MYKNIDPNSVYSVNHSKCMLAAFQNFRQHETMLDVTLVCNGKSLKAHKLVLSSCSDFFKELFSENPCNHPIVILRHFEFDDLKAVIDFIYKGELSVPRDRLMSALKIAADLNIRGLMSSGSNKEKFENLYNLSKKSSNRKKRKRHRYHSTDSEEIKYLKVTDSDQNVESDVDNAAPSESQVMDVDATESVTDDKAARPLVLHVGDLANEKSASELPVDGDNCDVDSLVKENLSIDAPNKSSSALKEDPGIYDVIPENNELSSQLDSHTTYTEVSNQSHIQENEQSSFQDQHMDSKSVIEDVEKQCDLSPKSTPIKENEEILLPNEGKRFICSKCDSIFTSRINFMRHKALGHNIKEKSSYDCLYCNFIAENAECLKKHELTHNVCLSYKCNKCLEAFSSEEVYQKHISLHEAEEITAHGLSALTEQDSYSTSNVKFAKNPEFRCSICFVKFASKLRCQIHEKTCQGGS